MIITSIRSLRSGIAAIALAVASSAAAVSVNLTSAGTLQASLSDADPATTTTLTVAGPMNASDFDFINSSMTELSALDLSAATITAYTGDAVLLNRTEFAANELPAYALAGLKIKTLKLPKSLTIIGEGALSSSAIEAIDLAACPSLTTIGAGAFSNCNALTAIEIPAGVTSIGSHAFSRCDNLAQASILSSVDLPREAFANCPKLSKVSISGSPRQIADGAFSHCSALTTLELPSSLTALGASSFECSGLTSIDMSATRIASIGDWAFAKCPALTTVRFSESTSSLGQGLFFEDAALVSVALPSAVTEIPDYCFKGDTSVDTTAFVHPSITHIGNYALKDMSHVETITLPSDIEYLGDEAMAGWTSVKSIKMAEDVRAVPALGKDVWSGVDQPNVDLYVLRDMAEFFAAADQWSNFNISSYNGIEDPTVDPASPAASVKAWFEGTDLQITAPNAIGLAELFDLSGRCVIRANAADDTSLTIDTSGLSTRIYLVRLTMPDGTVASFKIAR